MTEKYNKIPWVEQCLICINPKWPPLYKKFIIFPLIIPASFKYIHLFLLNGGK